MKLNEKEALRYLGFRGKPADADTDEMIREICCARSHRNAYIKDTT